MISNFSLSLFFAVSFFYILPKPVFSQRTIDSTFLDMIFEHTNMLNDNNDKKTIKPLTKRQAKKIALRYLTLNLGRRKTFKYRPLAIELINDCWIIESYRKPKKKRKKIVKKGGGYYIVINNKNGKIEKIRANK